MENYEQNESFNRKICFYNNYEQMKVSTLKNLARERGLRGYSRLRKSELIE